MKKLTRIVLLSVMTVTLMSLLGCTKSKSVSQEEKAREKADIVVEEDMKIVVSYTEDFDKSYYSEDELQTKIDKEAEDFNEKYSTTESAKSLEVEEFNVKNEKATLKLRFNTYTDYNNYCTEYVDSTKDAKMVVDKLSNIKDDGVDISDTLCKAEDGKEISAEDISKLKDTDNLYCMYTNEGKNISLYGEVLYYSKNVSVENNVAKTTDKADNYVIYKIEDK